MTSIIVEQFHNFRTKIYNFFKYRADSTFDCIDAIAGQQSKESTVKISLSKLFRRTYSSLTDVVDNLFRREADKNLFPEELHEEHLKMTKLLMEQCPLPINRRFELFAVDCSSNPRVYAEKLEDRGFVHSPTKIPGQKPITVGHQYSVTVYLPEKSDFSEPHWVVPLSTERVKSEESGTILGMQQIIKITTAEQFKNKLCVAVNDSAYSNGKCLQEANKQENLVNIARIRNNRRFSLQAAEIKGPKKVGRPKKYGPSWKLQSPDEPSDKTIVERRTVSGKLLYVQIERWNDRYEKGSTESDAFLFDAVKVTVLREDGTALFKKPLWLMVTGSRRQELTLADIADSYFRRFDIEHFFRFGKQKLLLASFQTPDVRHEENWWWLCMISYTMLYQAKSLTNQIRNPWEKKTVAIKKALTPSQVQRDYERIIGEIGTPACNPKSRGKSLGRTKGTQVNKRIVHKIVKKSKHNQEEAIEATG